MKHYLIVEVDSRGGLEDMVSENCLWDAVLNIKIFESEEPLNLGIDFEEWQKEAK